MKNGMYDLVIKNGLVIDPHMQIHEVMDVAVSKGRIAYLQRGIGTSQASQVLDASGLIVTPGIIDLHVHCCGSLMHIGVDPEMDCLVKGCTTLLEAGSTGELNFAGLRRYVIERSKARIFTLLNIESLGMIEFAAQKQEWPKLIMQYEEMFINIENTLKTIEENRDVILGIKWAHHGLRGLQLAREAADRASCLLMAENHYTPEVLNYLKKGDIATHIFHPHRRKGQMHSGILDDEGHVLPEYIDAVKRGVILDVGHGSGSFSWDVAERALAEGVKPSTISTDLHVMSVKGPVYDMPTTMSKFLLLGLSLDEVIEASTWKPAEAIGRAGELGTLEPGACADISIFRLERGEFQFTDVVGKTKIGKEKLSPVKVVKDGKVVV